MLKIAICDDDASVTSQLEDMVEQVCKEKGIRVDTEVFDDGATLWQAFCVGEKYDLIYLDIEMGQMGGIEVAKKIREKDKNILFIFVSSYDSYCKAILEVEPFRFLDKPLDASRFEEYLVKANDRVMDNERCFAFHNHSVSMRIPYREIMYFESDKRVVILYTKREKYTFYARMNDVEERVRDNNRFFIRTHKSHLVNYQHIEYFGRTTVKMSNGRDLAISNEMREAAKKKYLSLLAEE